MGTFAVESDATVFLPKSEDPKEDNAYVEKSSKEEPAGAASWISQQWQFLLQPFTWISMLCRYGVASTTFSSFQQTHISLGHAYAAYKTEVRLCCVFFARVTNFVGHLDRELDVTFVVGVMVVYGLSQGVGFALNRVVVDYYWRDVQGKEPATVQLYKGVTWIPWDLKPVFGLLTDVLPFFGYHRRPYFVFAGLFTKP